MIDSATDSHATIHPSPTDNDNDGPSDSTCIASTSTVKHPIIGDASLDVLGDSAHHSEHAMPDVQRNNGRLAKHHVSIDFILDGNRPSVAGAPEASANDHHSTVHDHQSESVASKGWTLEDLNSLSAHYQEQSKIYKKLIENIAAGGSRGIPADRSVESSFERIDELAQKNNRIIQNVEYEIVRANNRQAHIVKHKEQVAKEVEEAKKLPLRFIADGANSTVYEIPETFDKLVFMVGPLEAISQERKNILHFAKAWKKLHPLIWSSPQPSWARQLLFPRVKTFVPKGWVRDNSTGLATPCENLDPRIPGFYDADVDRISVDCDERTGIVLSRIGDLEVVDLIKVLERCYNLEVPEVKRVLNSNDHCQIRIYLGRSSDDAWSDNDGDSISDVNMEDVADDASITTAFDDEPPSTLNLPGYLDYADNACRATHVRNLLGGFAQEMAFGYALLHWGARLDGRGIEFLLGSSPIGRGKRFYMLDFKDCRSIGEMTAQCVRDQLVPAVLENDPYVPRVTTGRSDEIEVREAHGIRYRAYTPKSNEVYVWEVFVKYYLEASAKIWEGSNREFDSSLPQTFIKELKKGFSEQDAERYADGVSTHHVASEDGNRDQTMQDNGDETEQGESASQEDPGYDGSDEDDQSQDDSDSLENDQYEDDEYDSDPMSIDKSEGEEDSDEDDDDYDDVD